MGFGGILKSVLSVAAPAIGAATGFPVLGSVIGGVAGMAGGGGKAPSVAGTAADPSTYIFYDIPGVDLPAGAKKVSLPGYTDTPQVPNLPNYRLPVYDTNAPTLPVQALMAGTGERGILEAIRQAQAYQAASVNPNDPLAKQLITSEDQALRNDFLRNLRDVITMNKRNRRRGRSLLDNERTDESILSAILSNASQSSGAARGLASQRLRDLTSSSLNTASAFGALASQERSRQDALRNDILNRVDMLRQDARLRNEQLRNDLALVTGTAREDILRRYGVNVENVRGKADTERQNITDAVSQWNANYGKLGAANAQVQAQRAANRQQNFSNIGDGISGILQAIGGSRSPLPWQAAGNVRPAYMGGGFY